MSNVAALLRKFIPASVPLATERESQHVNLAALLKKAVNIDRAAHEAATSDFNFRRKPTEAQAKAGNYKKGHFRIFGLDISIENPAGSKRRQGWPELSAHYGYIKRTEGADTTQIDVFIATSMDAHWKGDVFVIDQVINEEFDEHKVMLGYDSENQAMRAYLANYPKEWANSAHGISAVSIAEFKHWLNEGETTEPFATQKSWTQSGSATSGITAYGNTGKKKKKRLRLRAGNKSFYSTE